MSPHYLFTTKQRLSYLLAFIVHDSRAGSSLPQVFSWKFNASHRLFPFHVISSEITLIQPAGEEGVCKFSYRRTTLKLR